MIKKMYLAVMAIGLFAISCSNDDDVTTVPITPDAKEITGGPFSFVVDGNPDMVSGISTSSTAVGTNRSFIVTDDAGNILGLPPTLEALEGVDFDGAGVGTCLIWYIRYEDGLTGLEMGQNANNLAGSFDLSNSITVLRSAQADAKMITGGPFTFVAGDGNVDNVSGIATDPTAVGTNRTFVVTDDAGNILGLPPTLMALEGVDFDGAGFGECLIWYLRYEDGLTGAEVGMNASGLAGNFSLSNSISVNRVEQPVGGTITGGPFEFCKDGTADNVSGIALSGNVGSNSTWVVTDVNGDILGIPPTVMDVEGVNFDEAPPGECLIWHLSYEDDLTGAEVGMNASGLGGTFSLSNPLSVQRNYSNAGTIAGGPFTFTSGDGMIDNVSGITLDGTQEGTNSTWVITDDAGNILGLPPTLAAVEGVDFDGAGVGTCLIWYLRFEDGLTGAAVGNNADQLMGCFSLSNPITVTRN